MITKIIRIQHRDSGLGPFAHDIKQAGCHCLRTGYDIMCDLDKEIKPLIKIHGDTLRFGWLKERFSSKNIKNLKKLLSLGFGIVELDVIPLYINESDGQVVYVESFSESLLIEGKYG